MPTNFRVTLSLATPFYLSDPLTLDGLLSAAVANATGIEGRDTIPHIPLIQESGIFKGSCLFCHRSYRHVAVGRVMSLTSERDLSIELFRPKQQKYVHVDQARGPYKRNLSGYPGIEAREVYFWGVGDAAATEELIRHFVLGIGKRATGGAGEITSVSVEETDGDYSWMTRGKRVARPLPAAIWAAIGGDAELATVPLAVQVPYWASEKVAAVVPADWVAV